MRRLPLLAASMALATLAACATMPGEPEIPADAQATTRTEANGDTITEYRVGSHLYVVEVVPARGPTYYLYDRDKDGIVDNAGDNPPQTWFKLFEW